MYLNALDFFRAVSVHYIYANDLPANVSGAMTQFADDTSLAIENMSLSESEDNITNMDELK